MNTEVIFHKATLSDTEEICLISSQTFSETFTEHNTKADMEKYLTETFNTEKVRAEVNTPGTLFLLARVNNQSIGYAKLRHNNEAFADRKSIEIERIYLLKEFHHLHLGKALMKECLSFAEKNGYEIIWLGVWEHNPKAINFYKKWGFEFFGSHNFLLGDDVQVDLLMKKELNIDVQNESVPC